MPCFSSLLCLHIYLASKGAVLVLTWVISSWHCSRGVRSAMLYIHRSITSMVEIAKAGSAMGPLLVRQDASAVPLSSPFLLTGPTSQFPEVRGFLPVSRPKLIFVEHCHSKADQNIHHTKYPLENGKTRAP